MANQSKQGEQQQRDKCQQAEQDRKRQKFNQQKTETQRRAEEAARRDKPLPGSEGTMGT